MVSDGIEQARQLSSPASRTPLAFEGFFLKGGRLRARWRFLIFVALWALCERTLFSAAAPLMVRAQGSRLPLPAFLVWALSFLAVMIPTAVMARVERQPLRAYGLPARGAFGALFWKGAAWGLVALTARILALRAIGAYSFGEVALRGPDVARYGLSWALVFLMIALFELYALLGYPQVVLSTRIGFWPAATALSVFFGTIHLFNGGLRSGRFGVDWASGLFTGVLAVLFFLRCAVPATYGSSLAWKPASTGATASCFPFLTAVGRPSATSLVPMFKVRRRSLAVMGFWIS